MTLRSRMATLGALLALVATLALPTPARAQDGEGDTDPRLQKIDKGMETATKQLEARDLKAAIATLEQIEKDVAAAKLDAALESKVLANVYYNKACAYSLAGEKEKALDTLDRSVDKGFDEYAHMGEDTDLDNIRHEARFERIVAKAKAAQVGMLVKTISKDAVFPFDFQFTAIDGKPVSLADYKGKVLLVDVWGTWCPPCRAEIPHLVELRKKLGGRGFDIVGLNCEREQDAKKAAELVKAFVAKQSIPYRCAIAGEAVTEKIPGFEGFPTMLLIDRQGRVRLKQVGLTPGEVLEAAVEALLKEGEAPKADAPKTEGPKPKSGEF